MPGKRMIDENICIDKKLNQVSEGAENLFYRLLVKTDDRANIFAESDLIKGQIYPRRLEISIEEIDKRVNELSDIKLILLYYKNNERYAHFHNFTKYQNLRKDIRPKITYPEPSRDDISRFRNDTLQVCNDPSTQEKLSKKVSKEEILTFKKLYSNPQKDKKRLKTHLKIRGFNLEHIKEVIKKVYG